MIRISFGPPPRAGTLLLIWLASVALGGSHAQGWELPVCAEPNSLPFSDRQERGFENRIAESIAEELGATLRYVWLTPPYATSRVERMHAADCDLVLGVTDGHPGFLTTLAYYRSSHVFVQRSDRAVEIDSLDDPVLADLAIGVQVGGEGASAGTLALASHGLTANGVGFVPDAGDPDPLAVLVDAVASGEVDVAIVWGPVAGYFAGSATPPLEITPVTPQFLVPFVPMVASIAMGVRPGDEALAERLNTAIARRWDEIQAILRGYEVPLLEMPRPSP